MSNYPNEWPLNLNDDTFNALKTDFNAVLRKTLSNMETKESEAAELTIKLKISLKKEKAPFNEGPPREVVVPKFDHKVSSVMQIKDELTGTLGGNYELVWDKERGEFIMREIVDGQQTIWDADYEVVEPDAQSGGTPAGGESGTPALPGGQPLMLPEKTEENAGCVKDFPDCTCLTCMKCGEEVEGESCCVRHARDCKDKDGCVDYINSCAPDGYQYEEPEKEDGNE